MEAQDESHSGVHGEVRTRPTGVLRVLRPELEHEALALCAGLDPWLHTHPPHLASKKLPVFMRVCGVAPLVIESPKPPKCHPEREGGGWGGREGSPHKSWCRSTVIAEILRAPRAHPPIAQDATKFTLFLLSGSALAL